MAAPTVRSRLDPSGYDDGGDGDLTALHLTVMGPSVFYTRALPASGSVTIGRDEQSDVRITDADASRVHARLHVGEALEIEDLGSANGTRLREARIPPGQRVPLAPGEGIAIGSTTLMVQRRGPGRTGEPQRAWPPAGPVSVSEPMRQLQALAARAAAGDISVLILGETGAGKEVLAQAIHRMSPRAAGPFVCVNCAALAESLFESELFGHEKGAFTGAVQGKPGLLETAARGTVFLDEIGEMDPALQSKVLRAIESRQVTRVGAVVPRPIDVRFIAATNRDLDHEVRERRFRQDLYFRLSGITLAVPPLRARAGDVEPLARSFLEAATRALGRPPLRLGDEARALFARYAWPGNVRELRNVIDRAVLLCDGAEITPEHLPMDKLAPAPAQPPAGAPQPDDGAAAAAERQRLVEALDRCAGNQTRAAAALGISRRSLCEKIKFHRIPRPRS